MIAFVAASASGPLHYALSFTSKRFTSFDFVLEVHVFNFESSARCTADAPALESNGVVRSAVVRPSRILIGRLRSHTVGLQTISKFLELRWVTLASSNKFYAFRHCCDEN